MAINKVEPTFVDSRRIEIVNELFSVYETSKLENKINWISLEGPSGWGKTRIVQEFFSKLSSTGQGKPPYWPQSITETWIEESEVELSPNFIRKRIYPSEFSVPGKSTLEYFWLGITCEASRNNNELIHTAAAQQFDWHQAELERAIKSKISFSKNVGRELKKNSREIKKGAVGDFIGIAGLALPPIGIASLVAKYGLEAYSNRKLFNNSDRLIGQSQSAQNQVDELMSAINEISNSEIPVVIVVEDMHLANQKTMEFLTRLVQQVSQPIFLITTSHTGFSNVDDLISNLKDSLTCRRFIAGVTENFDLEQNSRSLIASERTEAWTPPHTWSIGSLLARCIRRCIKDDR